jgi:Tol biopolymer transport system component
VLSRRRLRLFLSGTFAFFSAGCALVLGLDDGTPRGAPFPDAGSDVLVEAAPDVDAAPLRCDPTKAFGAPVLLSELVSSGSDSNPKLTEDELELAFQSTRDSGAGGEDLYLATRAVPQGPFGAVTPIAALNLPGYDADPAFSRDGLTLYFATDRPSAVDGGGAYDLWTAARASRSTPFGSPAPLAGANSVKNEQFPSVTGNAIYFASARGASIDLFRGDLGSTGVSSVTPLVAIDTPLVETSPVINGDETVLFFASNRGDAGADFDVWVAVRTSATVNWPAPSLVAEVSSPQIDVPSWLSPDLCRLYLTSYRTGTPKPYVATRTP